MSGEEQFGAQKEQDLSQQGLRVGRRTRRLEEEPLQSDPQRGLEHSSKEAETLFSMLPDYRVTSVPWGDQHTARAVVGSGSLRAKEVLGS